MAANSIGGPLRRRRTAVTKGPEGPIVEALTGLLEHPHDRGLMNSVVRMLFQDSKLFMKAVVTHFFVPASGMRAHLRADADSFPCGKAKTWQNYVATQTAEPFEIACPKTRADLQAALAKATAVGCPVRAAGSHHAWSDAALTDGIAIETHGLLETPGPADATLLKNPADAATLWRVSGGMTIRDLNTALDQQGLALINMGGFDGQTLAGVISTSTHGSGLSLGAFPSFVEALIVINADGQAMQIEKTNGITDPAKFAAHGGDVQLIQNDKIFNASVVGIGCLGIIYAVILRVRTQYWLSETRTVTKWTDLKGTLREGSILRNHRHVEVLINPHVMSGDHTCLLTLRCEVPRPAKPSPPKPFRNLFAELLGEPSRGGRSVGGAVPDFSGAVASAGGGCDSEPGGSKRIRGAELYHAQHRRGQRIPGGVQRSGSGPGAARGCGGRDPRPGSASARGRRLSEWRRGTAVRGAVAGVPFDAAGRDVHDRAADVTGRVRVGLAAVALRAGTDGELRRAAALGPAEFPDGKS